MKVAAVGVAAAALMLLAASRALAGEAISYELVPRSTVLQVCTECTEPAGRPEPLNGAFYLTPMNLAAGSQIEAMTDVRWESASYRISGSGFVQYSKEGRLQVELKATINGEELHLRATRRQAPRDGLFSVVLATPRDAKVGYLIVVTARMESAPVADLDFDGVGDQKDNCRSQANVSQNDGDFDGVGDACDECPGTPSHALVNSAGCALDQSCPCSGPRSGGIWRRGAYAKCVAKAVRDLRRLGAVSRSEAGSMVRRALANGCGETVVASLDETPFSAWLSRSPGSSRASTEPPMPSRCSGRREFPERRIG